MKEFVATHFARLLRAGLVRVSGDIELHLRAQAGASSAELVSERMSLAKAVDSRKELMRTAIAEARVEGLVCEFGVYRGESLNFIADCLGNDLVFGFDTFDGLPEDWRSDYQKGAFRTDLGLLKFRSNCQICPGLFSDTLPTFLSNQKGPAKLIHVDCDLYGSTVDIFKNLGRDRIISGTIIVFDEYFNYPGWKNHEFKALEEFLSWSAGDFEYVAYNKTGEQVAIRVL